VSSSTVEAIKSAIGDKAAAMPQRCVRFQKEEQHHQQQQHQQQQENQPREKEMEGQPATIRPKVQVNFSS
jgi:hypothetical protein